MADDFEDEQAYDDEDLYDNMGKRRPAKYKRDINTALSQFDKFLAVLNAHNAEKYRYRSLSEVPDADFGEYRDIFGQFPEFLRKDKKVTWGTCTSYVSKVKVHICEERTKTVT